MTFFIVCIIAVPSSIVMGILAQKFGSKAIVYIALLIYIGVSIYAAFLHTQPFHVFGIRISELYVLALLVGLVIGGIKALSRSFFLSIIPQEKSIAYFGFFSMIGKSSAFIGPLIIAFFALLFNNPHDPTFSTRLGMGLISIVFVVAAVILFFVKEKAVENDHRVGKVPDH